MSKKHEAGHEIPRGHIEVFSLSAGDKDKKGVRREFRRAALQLANHLATTKIGKKRVKNAALAAMLAAKLCELPYDAFSRVSPEYRHAFKGKNLVFRIRQSGEESLNEVRAGKEAIVMRRPRKRILLPWSGEKGAHVIPLTVELPVPLTAQRLSEAGRSARKIARAFSQISDGRAASRRKLADDESIEQLHDPRVSSSRRGHVQARIRGHQRRVHHLQRA